MADDRHARHRRTDADRRRRPVDGFRARDTSRFERLVEDAITSLPHGLLGYLEDVRITVEEVPPAEGRADGTDEVVLGLYRSVPRTRPASAAARPDHLTLYRRPLEARSTSKEELTDIVQETVVDEIALHFGIDDDRLDELGWT